MAEKRAVSIGGVTFDFKLHYLELDEPNDIQSEASISESGVHIVWQNKIQTPYITLSSKDYGWVYQSTKDAILALYEALDTTYTLSFDDGSSETVRFAHERGINFTPHFEGCDTYTAQINLAKVIV